jgi:hypothetical protein
VRVGTASHRRGGLDRHIQKLAAGTPLSLVTTVGVLPLRAHAICAEKTRPTAVRARASRRSIPDANHRKQRTRRAGQRNLPGLVWLQAISPAQGLVAGNRHRRFRGVRIALVARTGHASGEQRPRVASVWGLTLRRRADPFHG